jgi:hypothetical protein
VTDPRLLALHSEIGYVDRLDRALPDEPEAVSESEQTTLTQRALRDKAKRERESWIDARDTMRAALATLDVPAYALIARDVRALRRTIERIDTRLR